MCSRSRCSRLALGWRRHPLVKGPDARVSWQPLPALQGTGRGGTQPRHVSTIFDALRRHSLRLIAHELPICPSFYWESTFGFVQLRTHPPANFDREMRVAIRVSPTGFLRPSLQFCSSIGRLQSRVVDFIVIIRPSRRLRRQGTCALSQGSHPGPPQPRGKYLWQTLPNSLPSLP